MSGENDKNVVKIYKTHKNAPAGFVHLDEIRKFAENALKFRNFSCKLNPESKIRG